MDKVKMLGAIAGDIIGSTYEFCNTKSMDFELFEQGCRFTDDSVMTLAVAKWLTEDEAHTIPYLIYCMQELGHLSLQGMVNLRRRLRLMWRKRLAMT